MSVKLGELLLNKKVITEAQLKTALDTQGQIGGKLGYILVKLHILNEDQLAAFLGEQLKIPVLSFSDLVVQPSVSALVDVEILEKHQMLPIRRTGDALHVVLADPLDMEGVDGLHFLTGLRIEMATASRSHIGKAIDYYFHGKACPELQEAEKVRGIGAVFGQGSGTSSGIKASSIVVLQALTDLLIEKKIIARDELLAKVSGRGS